jgi:hypothetical protein
MKRKYENNKKKIDTKKAFMSVLFMILLMIGTSYLFQSCDASIIDPSQSGDTGDLINDFVKGDDENDDLTQISYFSQDIITILVNQGLYLSVEDSDISLVPTNIDISDYNNDRNYGWAILSGFENNINNGFCYFEVDENSIFLDSEDSFFIASINFDECWQVEEKIFVKMRVNNKEYNCYFTLE